MYIDVVLLIVLMVVVIMFFKRFSSFVFFMAIVDILLRILTFIKNNIGLPDVSSLIGKYVPASIPAIIDKYATGIVNTILQSKNNDTKVGLPIGNQTSQWFALFYLNKVDRLIKEKLRVKYYVRYIDDMILVHNDKEYLKFCKQEIEKCVKEELDLSLNSKTQIGRLRNGIDFLGFRHMLCEKGKIKTFLRGQAKLRLRKNVKTLSKLRELNLVDKEYIDVRLNSFKAHLCHSNSKKLLITLRTKYKI